MSIERQKFITRIELRKNPDKLYLFGDNEARAGYGGQAAAMRGEPNAVGIRTKRKPNADPDAYWDNGESHRYNQMIVEDFAPVLVALRAGKTVVIPEDGIGTGMAQLQGRAPDVFRFLNWYIDSLEKLAAEAA